MLSEFKPANYNLSYLALLLLIAVYLVIWITFFPKYISTSDEYHYVYQAKAFAQGQLEVRQLNLTAWVEENFLPSQTSPGTSALMTPFLFLGNWKLVYFMPLICQLLVALLIAWVLKEDDRSPLFALLFLTYPVAVVFGRMLMSDMPNMLFFTGSLALFWVGARLPERPGMLFFSGVLAGLSLLFRHTNVLVLAPFFLSHVLRRRPGAGYLIVGGMLGCLPRFAYYWLVWGNPLHFESVPQGFSFFRFYEHLAFYGLSFNFLLPGLPFLAFLYRGRYRGELFAAVLIYFLFYCFFEGGAPATGFKKRLILANRYMLPLAPLFIWAAAEPLSRWAALLRANYRRTLAVALVILVIPYWVVLLHQHEAWSAERAQVRQIIYANTLPGSIIIHNSENTRKYLLPFGEPRHQYCWREIQERDLLNAQEHGVPVFTAFVRRGDRSWFQACLREFLAHLTAVSELRPIKTAKVGEETLEISRVEKTWAPLKPVAREECYSTTPPLSWSPD